MNKPTETPKVKPFGITLVREDKTPSMRLQLDPPARGGGTAADTIGLMVNHPAGSGRPGLGVVLQPEEAVQMAAYLIAMARMAGLPHAESLYDQYLKDAQRAAQQHLAARFPGFVPGTVPQEPPK